MINGVIIKKLKVYPDTHQSGQEVVEKPGVLMEVLRADEKLMKKFGQTTFTIAYPGTIKAFHWHKIQDDLFFFATGKALLVLYDLRQDSPTFGKTQTIEAGDDNYQLIVVPQGVAHGYKVLGRKPVMLFYQTTECYNRDNPDEERIPYNDTKIGFEWEKHN